MPRSEEDKAGTLQSCNEPLPRKLKYVRNVGDIISGGASAAILCTEKIAEISIPFVRQLRVSKSC